MNLASRFTELRPAAAGNDTINAQGSSAATED